MPSPSEIAPATEKDPPTTYPCISYRKLSSTVILGDPRHRCGPPYTKTSLRVHDCIGMDATRTTLLGCSRGRSDTREGDYREGDLLPQAERSPGCGASSRLRAQHRAHAACQAAPRGS